MTALLIDRRYIEFTMIEEVNLPSDTNKNSLEGRWQVDGFSDNWEYNEIAIKETQCPGQENENVNISGDFHAVVSEGANFIYEVGGVRFLNGVILGFYENRKAQFMFLGEIENEDTISGSLVETAQRNKNKSN